MVTESRQMLSFFILIITIFSQGVSFEEQLVEEVPTSEHDKYVHEGSRLHHTSSHAAKIILPVHSFMTLY